MNSFATQTPGQPASLFRLADWQTEHQRSSDRVLAYFATYRVALSALLLGSFLYVNEVFQFGLGLPRIAKPAFIGYAVGSLLLLGLILVGKPGQQAQLRLQFGFDVVALSLLTAASGGVRSGISVLLLISVASAALCARGRFSLGYAAAASVMLLLQQSYLVLRHDWPPTDFTATAIACLGYFAVALVTRALASYAEVGERLATERGMDAANLASVNALVLQQVQDGVVVVDHEGVIRQSNKRAEECLGVAIRVGQRLDDVNPEVAERLTQWHVSARSEPTLPATVTQSFSALAPALTIGGRDIAVRIVDFGLDQRPINVVLMEDLTRAKQAAQQLKLASLGRLTASIAHEIRNPLSCIGQAADLLREEPGRPTADDRGLEIIQQNVQRIDRLIEEVLYLNRRDRTKPQVIGVAKYLTEFVRNFCTVERIASTIIAVDCHPETKILFDPVHLDQIVWNLVRNAVRYSNKEHSAVWIVCREFDQYTQVSVIDNGPGVSHEQRSRLFEPFATTEQNGTGIGLYMARELAEANGAPLEYVDEDSAGGAHFRLTVAQRT